MEIEEFNVKIEKEKEFFVALITFPDGEERATQGRNIFECYDMIADLLKLRCEDEEDAIQRQGVTNG